MRRHARGRRGPRNFAALRHLPFEHCSSGALEGAVMGAAPCASCPASGWWFTCQQPPRGRVLRRRAARRASCSATELLCRCQRRPHCRGCAAELVRCYNGRPPRVALSVRQPSTPLRVVGALRQLRAGRHRASGALEGIVRAAVRCARRPASELLLVCQRLQRCEVRWRGAGGVCEPTGYHRCSAERASGSGSSPLAC